MEVFLPILLVVLALYAVRLERRLNESTRRWQDLTRRIYELETQVREISATAVKSALAAPQGVPVPASPQFAPAPPFPQEAMSAPAGQQQRHAVSVESEHPEIATPVDLPSGLEALAREAPVVPPPPPIRPSPTIEAAPEPPAGGRMWSVGNLEEVLGTNWLNKLGVIILVIGVALFLAYQLQHVGPLGKVVAGYVVSAAMLGAGFFFEKNARYRLLARASMGGGWALAFFTTFAMYQVPAARVISSQPLDLALLLIVGAGMVAHSLKYRTQVVTGLAFLLAFLTFISVSFSRPDLYSASNLYVNAILALGLIVIAFRLRWFEMETLGILATYLTHYLWLWPIIHKLAVRHHEFPGYLASSLLLTLYWLAFRCSYVVRRPADRQAERVSTAAALLNSALYLWVMGYQSAHPELAFRFFLGVGAVELVLGQLPITRRRRPAFVVLTTLGTVLLVAAFPYKFSGSSLSLWWLVEAEALFLAGVFSHEIVFRRLGVLAGLVVAGQMISFDLARVFGQRFDGAHVVHEPRLGLVFAAATLLFYADAHWIPRRWSDLTPHPLDGFGMRLLSFAAGLLAFAGVWIVWPDAWAAVFWAGLALAVAIGAARLQSNDLRFQANFFALAAVVRVLLVNVNAVTAYYHVSQRLMTIAVVAAVLYAFSRWSGLAEWRRTRRLAGAYVWVATALLMLLAWYELRPVSVVPAWVLLALVLFELGFARGSLSLRLQSYAIFVSAFLRIFYVNLNAGVPGAMVSPRVYTTVPLALALFYIYSRLTDRQDDFLAKDRGLNAAGLHCFLGTFTVVALLRFELDPDWVVTAWAALALALAAIARKTGRRMFLHQGLFLAFVILFRTILHNFYERSYFPPPFWHGRVPCVGLTVALLLGALLFGFKLRRRDEAPPEPGRRLISVLSLIDRHPDQVFFFVPVLLLTGLLAVEVPKGLVTLAWGLESVAVFLFALRVAERSFRLTGLGLLLLSVAKIIVIDVWGMNPRDRYLTFIVLGSALVLVSFLYTRYRETLRQYL